MTKHFSIILLGQKEMNKNNKTLTMQKPKYHSVGTDESYVNWIKRFVIVKKEKI